MRAQDQDNPWQWQPVTRPQAEAFARWQYEPPYDFYNVLADPDDAPAAAQQADYFLKPATRCHTLVDAAGEVIAFCTFGEDARVPGGDYSQNALDIGLAVRPDLTGRGLGSAIVSTLVAFARRRFRPPLLRVTIAEWNRRAQRVWAGQGFEVTARFLAESHTQQPFLILQLTPERRATT